jgi:hypothetical protein
MCDCKTWFNSGLLFERSPAKQLSWSRALKDSDSATLSMFLRYELATLSCCLADICDCRLAALRNLDNVIAVGKVMRQNGKRFGSI